MEFSIKTPKSFSLQNTTWSSYKQYNTIKYLLMQCLMVCSTLYLKGFSGHTSDKQVVICSGFLDLFMPGDKILADKGFLIREEVLFAGAELIMPPGKKGQSQMTSLQILKTKKIAN